MLITPEQLQRLTVEYYPLFLEMEEQHRQLNKDELQVVAQYSDTLRDLIKGLALNNGVDIAAASDAIKDDLMAQYKGYIRAPIRSAIAEIEHQTMLERVASINSVRADVPDIALSAEEFRLINDEEFRQQMIRANVNDQVPMFLAACNEIARKYFNLIHQQPSGPPKLRA